MPAPRALAVAGDRLYVLDGTGRLRILNRAGGTLEVVRLVKTDRGFPAGIAVEPAGTLLVADTHESRILRLSPHGEILQSIGRGYGSESGQFVYPQRIAVGPSEIYVTEYGFEPNNRVQVFAPDGTFLRCFGTWGKTGARFSRACGIVLGPGGDLFVADASHRIVRVTPEGVHVGDLGSPGREPGHLDYPFGLARDDRHLYAVEYGTHRISRFAFDGTFAGCFGGPGVFLNPRDVALDGTDLFVADTGHDRVVRLDLATLPWEAAP